MSQPCLRCGFPNDEKTLHCRACSAPLQEQGADTAIKPRLRQILAETRARTRARQRRGVSVDPNRVDVVPRLPSGVAASETALKTALEKGRQARLDGLREELRKGRPVAQPPTSRSLPPQEPGATLPPSQEELAAREQAKRAAEEKVAAEQAAAQAARDKAVAEEAAAKAAVQKAEAEQAAARAAAQKAADEKIAAEAAAQKALAERAAAQAAAEKAEIARTAARQAAEAAAATYLDETVAPPNPVRILSAQGATSSSEPMAASEATTESSARPVDESSSLEPQLVPALRAAGQQALVRLRAAAQRLRVEPAETTNSDEQRCALFDGRRCLVALIDAVPALVASSLWLGTAFSGAKRPPEEVLAAWLLGEAGGLPIGLLAPCFAWLIWAWVGIALWRVSPGMKVMGLCWSEGPIWRVYARPLVFIISLLPLGLGATYALIDRNSRGLSDIVLRLRWLRQ